MKNEELKAEITQFFDHFREASAYFKKLLSPNSHNPNTYRLIAGKTVCCSLLDALSIARFGGDANRKKLKRFLKHYTSYKYWDRVSIPQILYNLEALENDHYPGLKCYAQKVLVNRNSYSIQDDPLSKDLTSRFPKCKKGIEAYSHLALFYKYRNKLVHEMRQPGYGYEFEYDEQPRYRTQTEARGKRLTFQLTYPLMFFFSTCDECISNLEKYFLTENKSPFDAFEHKFGDAW